MCLKFRNNFIWEWDMLNYIYVKQEEDIFGKFL